MDRVIKIRYELEDGVTAPTNNIVSGLTKVNKEIQRGADITKKSVKSADNSLADLGKRFLTIAVAIKVAKAAIGLMTDSLKEFDRLSQGTAVKDLQKAMGQLQVEIGSVLYPELKKFNKWFEENKQTITSWVTGVTSLVVSYVKVVIASASLVKNSFEEIVYVFFSGVSHLAEELFRQMYDVASRLPVGQKIKDSLKDAYVYLDIVGEDFQKSMNKTALDIADNYKTLGTEIKNIGKQIAGLSSGVSPNALSGIKFVSEEDLQKQKEALQKWLNAVEDITNNSKSMLTKAYDYVNETNSKYQEAFYIKMNGQEVLASQEVTNLLNNYVKIQYLHKKLEKEYIDFYEKTKSLKESYQGSDKAVMKKLAESELRASTALENIKHANARESANIALSIQKQTEAEKLSLIEEQARYELGLKENIRSTDIKAIDEYFLKIIETYKNRNDEILQVTQEYERKRSEAVNALRQEYTSTILIQTKSNPESTRNNSQVAMDKEVERRAQVYGDMSDSLKFTEEELSKYRISLEQYTVDQQLIIDQEYTDAKMQNIQKKFQAYADVAGKMIQLGQYVTQMQLNNFDRETEAKNKALDDAYSMNSKYVKNTAKLDKEYKDSKDKLTKEQEQKQKDLYKKQKGWSIANALISGAEATMGAWVQAMKLAYPANVIVGGIMSGVITALTASQVAMIASQKFSGGGIVKGPKTGDQVPIQANGGEMMLTTGQQAKLFQALNGQSSLGGQQVSIGGDTYIVHGNLDKNAADQIQRQKEQRMSTLKSDIRELSYRGQLSFA